MKAVISYRFTGESIDRLENLLTTVCNAMREADIEPFCIQFAKQTGETAEDSEPCVMMRQAFARIDAADMLFVVQTSEAKSEGMLMEVGYAIAKGVSVIVATHVSVTDTYLPDMAEQTIRYSDLEDLARKISSIAVVEPAMGLG